MKYPRKFRGVCISPFHQLTSFNPVTGCSQG
jgi:hypothetical protein